MISRSLLVRLSSFRDDAASLAAAQEVLAAPDREATLDRLYVAALPQRILLTALAHLERADGHGDGLTVSAPLFRSLWPLNALLPPPDDPAASRVRLSWVRRGVDAHRVLLRRVATDLIAGPAPRAMAVFGLAYETAYPTYHHREHNDADVYAPDAAAALRIVEELLRRHGFALLRFRSSRSEQGTLGHFKLVTTEGGYQLHVDVIGGGRPTGPGLRPPIVYPPLFDRARRIQTDGAVELVPAADDMLLLQAEKIQRRGAFTLRDFNDAQFLLVAEEGRIDWEYLVGAAQRHGIGGALHRLVREAERRESRSLTTPGVLRSLTPDRKQRRMIDAVAGLNSEVATEPGRAATVAARRWRRSWFRGYVRHRLTQPRALTGLITDLARGSLLKLQFRIAQRALARRLGRVGTHEPLAVGALSNPKAKASRRVDEG